MHSFSIKYIRLVGLEYVIKAMKLLKKYKDIKIILLGYGQGYPIIYRMTKELDLKKCYIF